MLVKASVLELYSVVVGGIASLFLGAGIFPGAGSERCLEAEEVILLLLPLLLSLVRLLLLLLLGCLLRLLLLLRLGSCRWCSQGECEHTAASASAAAVGAAAATAASAASASEAAEGVQRRRRPPRTIEVVLLGLLLLPLL